MSDLSPALAAFYDDCTYWANFARDKEKTMTLTLELPVEVETDLKAAAAARGVAVESVAVERLRAPMISDGPQARRARIERVLAQGRERLAPLFPEADPIATFQAERRADTERDEANWERLGL